MLRQVAVVILILSAGGLAQVAPQKHPFTFEDLMALKRVNEPVVYAVFIAPERDFSQLRPSYESMLRSVHLR